MEKRFVLPTIGAVKEALRDGVKVWVNVTGIGFVMEVTGVERSGKWEYLICTDHKGHDHVSVDAEYEVIAGNVYATA